jgi:restriction system protein
VLRLLVKMGYGGLETPTEHLGAPGDAGLDGLIRLDPLGLDVVYVQAKRYTDRHVGHPDIQAFVGALHGAQATRGVFITTSRFSADARDYAERVNARFVLIDGPELAALMIEHDCGVIVEKSFVLKQVDGNFFEEAQKTLCVQNTPRTSATVAHLGLRHGVHPLGSARVGSRCGQPWWSALRCASAAAFDP